MLETKRSLSLFTNDVARCINVIKEYANETFFHVNRLIVGTIVDIRNTINNLLKPYNIIYRDLYSKIMCII